MNTLGLLFAVGIYIAYVIIAYRIALRILVEREWIRHPGQDHRKITPGSLFKKTREVVLSSRLLSDNPPLWIGQSIFRLSFSLVVLRHLRYALDPVPGWVAAFQQPGLWAGFVLPLSLVYLLVATPETEQPEGSRKDSVFYVILFLTSFAGLLNHCPVKGYLPLDATAGPDLVGMKAYLTGIFRFSPGPFPDDGLLLVHFIFALVLLAFLPSFKRGSIRSGETGMIMGGYRTIAGLLVLLALLTYPFYRHSAGRTPGDRALNLVMPEDEKECIEPGKVMLRDHKKILYQWMDSAVRDDVRIYQAKDKRSYGISLEGTCMRCHVDKTLFCDRCHQYLAVSAQSCWNCHINVPFVKSEKRGDPGK